MKLGLKLRRPLAFIDLETTGTWPASDRIVEISILKIYLDGREDLRCKRVNPGVPIPPEATAKHGITDADVANEPPFAAYASSLHQFLTDCDVAGFNVGRFDLPMLEAEFRRTGIAFSREGRAVIDAMTIFHANEPRDLTAAVQVYCGRDFPEAHSSQEDARAAAEVLGAQLERYDDLPRDVDKLHELLNPADPNWIDPDGRFKWVGGAAVIAIGKHAGRTLQELAAQEPTIWSGCLVGTSRRRSCGSSTMLWVEGSLSHPINPRKWPTSDLRRGDLRRIGTLCYGLGATTWSRYGSHRRPGADVRCRW